MVAVLCVALRKREVAQNAFQTPEIEKVSLGLSTAILCLWGDGKPGNRYIHKLQVPLINKEETQNLHMADFIHNSSSLPWLFSCWLVFK